LAFLIRSELSELSRIGSKKNTTILASHGIKRLLEST